MSKVIYATKMQKQVIESQSRITVITAEPGAGSTVALLLKAYKEASDSQGINISFFVPSILLLQRSGSVREAFLSMFKEDVRYSEASSIATLGNGSKIKFIPCDRGVEFTLGLSGDLMLFDANVPKEFILAHVIRANKLVIVDSIVNLEKEESWANKAYLLDKVEGKVTGFCESVNHITGTIEENFLFSGDVVKYKELVRACIPEKMKISFGSIL